MGKIVAYRHMSSKMCILGCECLCECLSVCVQVGDVTILVNNAAVVHGKSLMNSDDDALLKTQHINTLGQFWVSSDTVIFSSA